jgi:hypothetical protein
MGAPDGPGADSAVSAFTCIVTASSTAMFRDAGGLFVHIGTCGSVTTTTNLVVGSGVSTGALVTTFTDGVRSEDGSVTSGFRCVVTGDSFVETITAIVSMVASDGSGVDIAESVCTGTVFASCSVTTMVTGGESVHTGLCSGEIITTSQTAGSGPAATGVSAGISTAIDSIAVGMVLDGTTFAVTGVCGEKTVSTTGFTVAPVGNGALIVVLVFICIVAGSFGEITKGDGEWSAVTGTSGATIITIDRHDGSGAGPDVLGVICIACEPSNAGLEQSGSEFAPTGTCTGAITTTTGTMDEGSGGGQTATNESVCIATDTVSSMSTIRVGGAKCVVIGTCGAATTTTRRVVGSGVGSAVSAAIFTACAFSSVGPVLVG